MSRAIQRVPVLNAKSPLTDLKGIGPVRSRTLAQAGCSTVIDLLAHLPVRYEDRRHRLRIEEIKEAGRVVLWGRLDGLKRVRIRRRRMSLVRGWVEDDSGRIPVIWFNQPYLLERVVQGSTYSLYGEVKQRGDHFEIVNPTCDRLVAQSESPGIVPIYRPLEGLGSGTLRRLIAQAIDSGALEGIEDPIPVELRRRHGLPTLAESLATVHRPSNDSDVSSLDDRRTSAHARLSYGEFLELQIELGYLRQLEVRRKKSHRYTLDDRLRGVMRELLPFRLTQSQRQVLREIAADLAAPYPMLRLLQGDVGCGKTIVAIMALVVALENGLQGAFMAPTELLAEQHFRNFSEILADRYGVDLLTSSVQDRSRIRSQIATGRTQLVIGTHALIQEGLEFANLGLAVVDEQHRFGVGQRRHFQRKGDQPDLLVMTATPIPRSLALTAYGDLSLSVIDELPPGRRPIKTTVVPAAKRSAVYRWLNTELSKGGQAYVVFPLIEESDSLTAESIASMGEKLRRTLGDLESAVVHGRMEAAEREEIMSRFRDGQVRVLLATTVIEVGVDVPDASIMLIESGERFGLAQLHQLRGRVGRGSRSSRCVVIHGRLSEDAQRRLEVFAETSDGFRIAEADLQIRGPGDLLGTRQSGVPFFRLADIVRDHAWLERARDDARELIFEKSISGSRALLGPLLNRARSRYEEFAGG